MVQGWSGQAWPQNVSGAQKAEGDSQQLNPGQETRTLELGDQKVNDTCNVVKSALYQHLEINALENTRYNATYINLNGEFAVKPHTEDFKVWTSQ